MILMANVANLDRFVTLKFDSKHCFSFFCVFITIYIIYDWITIIGFSKHEFSAINMFP